MMNNIFRRAAAVTSLLLLGVVAADAAAVRSGATITTWIALTRGTNVAYDPINHVYLVVGAHGVLRGRFVARDGTPLGSPFQIQASANFTSFPRVAFSPDADGGAGGFLVTWSEVDLPSPAATSVHGRMVSFTKGPYSADTRLTTGDSWWEEGAYIAYSTGSHEFLVVYRTFGTFIVRGLRVDNNAAPRDAIFTISQTGQFEDNPSVAYNPVTNQYLVCWKGWNLPGNFGLVDCRFVQAGANQLLAGPIRITVSAGTYITDTTYNPATNQFLVTWENATSFSRAIYGRLVNADGTLPGNVFPISSLWHAYDALSVGYNRLSQTFFMVSHCASCYEDGGVELKSDGTPVDNGFKVTATGGTVGNFYPTIAPADDDPNWLVTTANGFTSTMHQMIAGTAVGPPPPPPPPPAPVSKPWMSVDTPGKDAKVPASGFLIAGWALDLAVSSGTGVDVVAGWAWPDGGAPAILAGVASAGSGLGYMRPDVAAAFGSAQFTPSGFGFIATLPAGGYTLAVYAHSTFDGSWAPPSVRHITVTPPVSVPRMWIDLPAQNQVLTQSTPFTIAGWAIDLGAPAGPGVDVIHVYASPAGASTPIFLGAGRYGDARPDVGAAFGSSRFAPSGFYLSTMLAPGDYTIVVFARSTVTNTWNAAVVNISVR